MTELIEEMKSLKNQTKIDEVSCYGMPDETIGALAFKDTYLKGGQFPIPIVKVSKLAKRNKNPIMRRLAALLVKVPIVNQVLTAMQIVVQVTGITVRLLNARLIESYDW